MSVWVRVAYHAAMKLYTKRGDAGRTDLIGGPQVNKDDLRVEAYGCVDELNAALGLVLSDCHIDAIKGPLITAQHRLFDLGAQLATCVSPSEPAKPRIAPRHVVDLEQAIDAACDPLPPLTRFILPGGSVTAARLHLARTICRRAERRVVSLAQAEPVDAQAIIYLNRLSDLLFALARLANQLAGLEDVPWQPDPELK